MQDTTFDGVRGVNRDGLAVRLWHGLLAALLGPDRIPADMINFCSIGRRTVGREPVTNCPGGEDGDQVECLRSERNVGPGPGRIEDNCRGTDGEVVPEPDVCCGEQGMALPGCGLTERDGMGSLNIALATSGTCAEGLVGCGELQRDGSCASNFEPLGWLQTPGGVAAPLLGTETGLANPWKGEKWRGEDGPCSGDAGACIDRVYIA